MTSKVRKSFILIVLIFYISESFSSWAQDASFYKMQGDLYFEKQEYAFAIEKYQKATQSVEVIQKMALCHYHLKEFTRAETIWLSLLQKALSESEQINVYSNLANAAIESKSPTKAESYFKKGIALADKQISKGLQQAIIYNNVANFYHESGSYAEALFWYEKAKKYSKGLSASSDAVYAKLLNNLGEIYADLGNTTLSERYLKEALSIKIKNTFSTSEDLAKTYLNLGILYLKMNVSALAESALLKAQDLLVSNDKQQTELYALTMSALAEYYATKKDFTRAERLLKLSIQQVDKSSTLAAAMYSQLADIYVNSNKCDEALILADAALQIYKSFGKQTTSEYAQLLLLKAYTTQCKAQPEQTYLLLKESLEIKNKEIQTQFTLLSEKEKLKYWDKNQHYVRHFLSLIQSAQQADNTIGTLVADYLLCQKGLILQATLQFKKRLEQSQDTLLQQMLQTWQTYRSTVALYAHQYAKFQKELVEIQSKIDALEKQIIVALQKAGLKSTYEVKNSQQLLQTLSDEEAIIDIGMQRLSGDTSRYYAVIYHKNFKSPVYLPIPKSETFYPKQIKYYRNMIKAKSEDTKSYGMLMKPILDVLPKTVKALYIVPDGIYHQVSLNTLYDPESQAYLVQKYEMHLLTNAEDVLKIKQNKDKLPTHAVLFGRPTYLQNKSAEARISEDRAMSLEAVKGQFPVLDLPATETEVQAIQTLLQQNQITTQVYTKALATEGNLLKSAESQLIHVATHGFFVPEKNKNTKDAYLRSGLVLAGLDTDSIHDGIVTAYEMVGLTMPQTELMVFSACESGLGEVQSGQGVYGLQRAARVAGAQAVLMSLWTVNDVATQALMIEFYKQWIKEKNKHKALRSAQLALMKTYAHPYFWGAFVLVE